MKLSNAAFKELFNKCEKNFTKFAGKSTDLAAWQAFCKKIQSHFEAN